MNNCYLPVVKPEITASIEREVCDISDSTFIKKHLKRIRANNPTVAEFISRFAKETEDPVASAFCGILVYRLLESQAECNQMENELMI